MPMLPSCEGRRWEAAWRGSRDGPPDTELQRRMKDSPLAPSPASVPEIPPFRVRERVLILLQVCVSHDICPEGRWLAQGLSCWALSPGPVGAVW